MSPLRSVVDTLLVARFEVLRAIRTWRALALVLVYLLASAGGAYLFVEGLAVAESRLAEQLGVPATRWPGPMLDRLRESDEMLRMLTSLVGDEGLVRELVHWPFLAIFQLWQGFLLVPFLAAAAAAEALALDVGTRAIRYEALRTGRAELVAGRFLGQVGLTVFATLVALAGVWAVGMTFMTGQDPLVLAWGLLVLGLRAVPFAVPFVGLGVACSSLTSSPAWARVLALAATAGTWGLYGGLVWAERPRWPWIADALLPLLPQTWMGGLWEPGADAFVSAVTCVALGLITAGVGTLRFARRDL